MYQVLDLDDAFRAIEGIVDEMKDELEQANVEAQSLSEEIDRLEDQVADLQSQVKAWEEA